MQDDDKPSADTPAIKAGDMWKALRPLTAARIGLPRSGASLGTPALLDFRLAHARARDAVGSPLDDGMLQTELAKLGHEAVVCESAATDRKQYLMRPDLGRQLKPASIEQLASAATGGDLTIVVADGLSAQAAERHAMPVLQALLPLLSTQNWSVAPIVLLHNGRVAAGDAAAAALKTHCVLVLIGERPGLSSPDSLGAYMTWAPSPATSDADRNCISNIRPEGLPAPAAAAKIAWLLGRMRALKGSGVQLKDGTDALQVEQAPGVGAEPAAG
ncbi:MAG: ethanolamine ammonia-lyase subunit EutC [Polaromonas sp.]|nr:ethanolamine ammonia-lyase subunit EutC [Polaromonas sp.]